MGAGASLLSEIDGAILGITSNIYIIVNVKEKHIQVGCSFAKVPDSHIPILILSIPCTKDKKQEIQNAIEINYHIEFKLPEYMIPEKVRHLETHIDVMFFRQRNNDGKLIQMVKFIINSSNQDLSIISLYAVEFAKAFSGY
jgi:hypothetical protein